MKSHLLLKNIKNQLEVLETLLTDVNSHWNYEDLIYRYYHNSFKVFYIQDSTLRMVSAFRSLAPEGCNLNQTFENIISAGTGKKFKSKMNENWDKYTQPLLTAFFHAKYFLEMIVKYGKELNEVPHCLPSGVASILYLYNLRYEPYKEETNVNNPPPDRIND